MTSFDWDSDLSDSERDALVERAASAVQRSGLATPAILLLEMHKPLAGVAGQTLILGAGLLAPVLGIGSVRLLSSFLKSRANIERLIVRIEQLRDGRPEAAADPSQEAT